MPLCSGYPNTEPSDHAEEIASIQGEGCKPSCTKFFHKQKFCLCIGVPGSLIDNEWNIQPRTWIIYRVFMAVLVLGFQLYLLAGHLYRFSGTSGAPKFFIFLTNWSFIAVTATMITKAALCIMFRRYLGYDEEATPPRPFLVLWVLTNISTTAAVGVTLSYWTAVHNYAKPLTFGTIVGHIFNSVFVFVDLCLSSLPFRWGHFYQPLLYGLVYIFFSLIYWVSGGTSLLGQTAIYPILDWDRPELTVPVSIIGAPIVICVLHLGLSLLSALRTILAHRINTPR